MGYPDNRLMNAFYARTNGGSEPKAIRSQRGIKMKSIFLLVAYVFICSVISTLPPGQASDVVPATKEVVATPQVGPKIEVIEDVYNFGTLRQDEVKSVSHTFTFKSAGTADLVLTQIRPSCGCTSAVSSATQFAPGTEGTLTAVLNPKGKFGKTSISVRVATNDPANQQKVFRIEGNVLSPWRILPAIVDLREIGKGETSEKTTYVQSQYCPGDKIYRITGLKTSDPSVTAVTEEFPIPTTPDSGRQYLEYRRPVRISVTAGQKVGPQNATLFIATDDPKTPTHTINVRWIVEGDIAISKKRIGVRKFGDKSVSASLNISSRSGIPFEVLSVETIKRRGDDDALSISLQEPVSPTMKTYKIEVSEKIAAEEKMSVHLGDIIIKTNHPEKQVITIPYTATAKD